MSNHKLRAWSVTYFLVDKLKDVGLPTPEKIISVLQYLRCQKYAFQLERTEKNVKHYQMAFVTPDAYFDKQLREIFSSRCRKNYSAGCFHIKPTHSQDDAFIYCMKTSTRLDGPWVYPPGRYAGQDLITYDKLYPWQRTIFRYLRWEPHPRKINLIVQSMGNCGKSLLAKTLAFEQKAIILPLGQNSAQMKAAVLNAGPSRIYIVDLPRNNKSYKDIYDTLEEIKKGHVVSPFYGKYTQEFMLRPHVLIFTNRMPILKHLSHDMWRIFEISQDLKLCRVNKDLLALKQNNKLLAAASVKNSIKEDVFE